MAPGGDTTRPHDHVHPLPPPAAPAGDPGRLGGYRLERVLGRGGMGVVWQAESVALRRKVALKVLTAHGDPELVERFLIEARAAARIDHPNVVRVHEVGRDGPRWFLAMDLVDGESLRARVQRDGPLDPRAAAGAVEAVGRALHHAHGLGVLHRDVKPHNVLLSRDGAPRLADFGLAKLQGDATSEGITATGAVLGTPAYMAPEQAEGDLARVDRRTDVYALGATLYEALTGRPPFEGATAVNVLHQVLEVAPLPPSRRRPGLDRDLETICLRALEKEPGARYDTAAALADDLGRWSRGEPIVARRAGVAERLGKWARRRPDLALGAALLVTTSLAGAAAVGAAGVERRRAIAADHDAARARLGEVGPVDSATDGVSRSERLSRSVAALEAVRRWLDRSGAPEAEALFVDVALQVGDEARELEQYSTARQAYADAAARSPVDEVLRARDAAAALEEAHLLRRAGDAGAAGRRLEEARALQPDWVQVVVGLAELAHQLDDDEGAERWLAEGLRLRPDDGGLLIKRADVQTQLGRLADAARTAERLVEAHPGLAQSWLMCAHKRANLGDRAGALAACDRALELAPGGPGAASALRLRAHLLRGDPAREAEALVDLGRITELQPDSADALAQLADLQRQLGREAEAQRTLERALGLDPTHELALVLRALVSQRLASPADAAEHLEVALRLRPEDGQLLMRRAWVRLERNDPAGAEDDVNRALASLQVRRPAELLVTRAAARRMRGQHERAEADATAALALAPELPDASLARGVIRSERGDVSGAIADLERFLQLAPGDPQAPDARARLAALRARRAR